MNIILEAHRGVSNEYPENTVCALRAAVRLGYGMIEVDTKFTSDNRCVLLHDHTLNRTGRTADGQMLPENSAVCDWTFDRLRSLDFGVWRGGQFAGEPIPSLEEALAVALESGVPLKLDNVMWTHTKEQRGIMFDTIEKMNALPVVGFTAGKLEQIRELLTRFPAAYVHFDGVPDDENLAALSKMLPRGQVTVWLRQHNPSTAWCQTPPATEELAEKVRPVASIGLWLLTRPDELERAVALGADIAETDGSLRP